MLKELLAVYAVIFTIVGIAHVAKAQDGHSRYHEYYKEWMQPAPNDNVKCCNATTYEDGTHTGGDCEPTQAELRNGEWYARLPPYVAGKDGWPEWVRIPEEKIVREINPSPNEAHLCWIRSWRGEEKTPEKGVLCFVPPFGGM
jgi:hypothetical protein